MTESCIAGPYLLAVSNPCRCQRCNASNLVDLVDKARGMIPRHYDAAEFSVYDGDDVALLRLLCAAPPAVPIARCTWNFPAWRSESVARNLAAAYRPEGLP